MSLDELGRAATDDLHRHSGATVDIDERFTSLRRTKAARTRSRAILVAVLVVSVGVVSWLSMQPGTGDGAPATPSPSPTGAAQPVAHSNGTLVGQLQGDTGTPSSLAPTGWRQDGLPRPTEAWSITSTEPFLDASWSPDGTRLAYSTGSKVRLAMIHTDTDVSLGACSGCAVAWEPDGSRIAVTNGSTVELVESTGERSALVTLDTGRPWQLAWSPDGTRLAMVVSPDDGSAFGAAVVSVALATGQITVLARSSDTEHFQWSSPTWSPDGSGVAVLRYDRTSADAEWHVSVAELSPTGGATTTLDPAAGHCYCIGLAPDLVWSPDGTMLAEWAGAGLRLVDVADGSVTRVPTATTFNGPIAWQARPG